MNHNHFKHVVFIKFIFYSVQWLSCWRFHHDSYKVTLSQAIDFNDFLKIERLKILEEYKILNWLWLFMYIFEEKEKI